MLFDYCKGLKGKPRPTGPVDTVKHSFSEVANPEAEAQQREAIKMQERAMEREKPIKEKKKHNFKIISPEKDKVYDPNAPRPIRSLLFGFFDCLFEVCGFHDPTKDNDRAVAR